MILSNVYTKLSNGYQPNDINNPSKLLVQIVILQCFYYLSALVMFGLYAWLNGYDFKIDWIFSWELVASDNAMGLTLFILWLIDSLLCVLFVTIIVGRSKLAWDFAITVHIINLIVVWTYSGKFPTSILWWCLQVLSGVILVTLSTYSTRWKELRTTFFENMLDQQELGQVQHGEEEFEMTTYPKDSSSRA
ncbi:Protein SYS1 [Spathaspora sp. JA1]|nr:Protein SYS1 [Spathaspora sp. JA1]